MRVAVIVLLSAILIGVGGFQFHPLWLIADALLVGWSLGFIARVNDRAFWYRW